MSTKFRVLGAHANGNFFEIDVDACDGQRAFGAASLVLREAGEEGNAEFFAALPADAEYDLPGDSVVYLDTVLDPEQADVFMTPADRTRIGSTSTPPAKAISAETKPSLADGEVLGLDADGGLIQWNATAGAPYNSGQTVDEFGISNLSEAESKGLHLQGNVERAVAVNKLTEAVQTHQTAQVERDTELLGRKQAAMAERAFEAYNFGEGVAVAGVSGWEYYAAGHERSREVYVENVINDGKEKRSNRLGFTVRFAPQTGLLAEAYAEDATGSAFGCMPDGQVEKLNGPQVAETVLGEPAGELLGGDGKLKWSDCNQ